MSRSGRSPGSAGSGSSASVVAPGTNVVVLRGTLSRDPEERSLPSGDVVVAFDVTVQGEPGSARSTRRRAESVPVAWFDPPPSAARLVAGDEVVVVGRVRRRFFRAGSATVSRTEVVAERIVPARAQARVRAAVAALVTPIGGAG